MGRLAAQVVHDFKICFHAFSWPAGLTDSQNTVAFWRLFDLQKRKQSLQNVKESLQELKSQQDDSNIVLRCNVCAQKLSRRDACGRIHIHNVAFVVAGVLSLQRMHFWILLRS